MESPTSSSAFPDELVDLLRTNTLIEGHLEEWEKAITNFNAFFLDRSSSPEDDRFLPNKQAFLAICASSFNNKELPASFRREVVLALRILFRSRTALDPFLTEPLYKGIMEIVRIEKKDFSEVPLGHETDVILEGFRLLVNFLLIDREKTIPFFLSSNFAQKIGSVLTDPNFPKQGLFPIIRILRFYSLDSNCKSQMQENQLLNVIVDVIEDISIILNSEEIIQTVRDALELFYFLTSHLGPLEGSAEPTQFELDTFQRIIPLFGMYLSMPDPNLKYHTIKESVVRCLINVPLASLPHFDRAKTLFSLMEILRIQAFSSDGSASKRLTPILLILGSISKGIEASRPILKEFVFPEWESRALTYNSKQGTPVEYGDPEKISGILIQQMTSSDYSLHHFVCEFLFQICDSDIDELIRLTGMGNAYGVIASNKLMDFLGKEPSKYSSRSSSSSLLTEEASVPSTRDNQVVHDSDDEPLTEDECKAKDLYEKIERLQNLGVIKMISKEQTGDDAQNKNAPTQ